MSQFFMPRAQIVDVSGRPYPGAKANFYAAGTSTPLTVYSDVGLTIALSQPVIADAAGIFPGIYTPAGLYKCTITDTAGTLIWSQDNIDPAVSTSLGAIPIALGGTGATTAPNALANLGAASAAALTATQIDIATNYYSKVVNPIATDAQAIAATDATKLLVASNLAAVFGARGIPPHLWLRDEKAQNVAGGASLAGTNIRDISDVKRNTFGLTLAATQFTLVAGNWMVNFTAPSHSAGLHKAYLYNVTNSLVQEVGSSEFSNTAAAYANTHSRGMAIFTLAAPSTFELQHYIASVGAISGLGIAVNAPGLIEVYSEIQAWRIM